MRISLLLIAILLLLPQGPVYGATFSGSEEVRLLEAPPDNVYLAGSDIRVTAPLPADLFALGGSIEIFTEVMGDVLLLGGTILSDNSVLGDFRALGGKIEIKGETQGDIAVVGTRVAVSGNANTIFIVGGSVILSGSSTGPVTIYGTDVTLSGEFGDNVTVVASNKLTVKDDTRILGSFRYNSPQEIIIPQTVRIDGEQVYTGSYSYVPTNEEARVYAVAGAGLFFLVRVLGAMITAGLLLGLFPAFAKNVARSALTLGNRRGLLMLLLGLALLVVTPILLVFLFVSFVGAGLALLLGTLYILLILLAYLYAGIIIGAKLRESLFSKIKGNSDLVWRDGVIGMFVFYLIGTIPYVGATLTLILVCLALGVLSTILYRFAFTPKQ